MADKNLFGEDQELDRLVEEQARDDGDLDIEDADDDTVDAELADADVYDDDGQLAAELLPLEGEEETEGDDVIGEDDDNAFGEPDEALPDDREEHAIEQYDKREASLDEDS